MKGWRDLLSPPGKYPGYGLYTPAHGLGVLCTLCLVVWFLRKNRHLSPRKVRQTIRFWTALFWGMESGKVLFEFLVNGGNNLNAVIPLYFCSIPLYCGLLSGYGKGKWKRAGDIFLAVGGIGGGLVYLLVPSTTAREYPLWHLLTIQSFLHHGGMLYLGLLLLETQYLVPKKKDWFLYASVVGTVCLLAGIGNARWQCNLMFLSGGIPGTFSETICRACPWGYPYLVVFSYCVLPFFPILWLTKKYQVYRSSKTE